MTSPQPILLLRGSDPCNFLFVAWGADPENTKYGFEDDVGVSYFIKASDSNLFSRSNTGKPHSPTP